MEFLVLWLIGIAIVIGTRIGLNILTRETEVINENSRITQVLMHILVIICIVLVGGLAVGGVIGGWFINPNNLTEPKEDIGFFVVGVIMYSILGAALTYLVGFLVLGLYKFNGALSHICFAVVFIISILGWTGAIYHYNLNIEINTETVVEQTQERELIYFCNIPVQEISGTVSGSSVLGNGKVSGKIDTTDKLPYWYLNKKGEGVYGSSPAKNSKMVFDLEEGESPYLEIVKYASQTITINHNNGKETSSIDKNWTTYYFHVPEELMQYNLE